jgi:tyrosinase
MAIRTRKDVWKLDEWDPILLWYARAVADMQTRPLNDPTSWRYQAAIHDYDDDTSNDPLWSPGDTLPSVAERKRFWKQCQHFSWFFLPWHRMYLAFFEQIVMAAVERLGGPADWALPYWNYSDTDNTDARVLPPAFRAETLPDGSSNALRVEQRVSGANAGNSLGSVNHVDLSFAFGEHSFIAVGGGPGFGGPRTDFNHEEGDAGAVEVVPHGAMHMGVGGSFPPGWMSSFNTAPLDPIFWLHHCNIDRLWEVWLRENSQHLNPDEAQWLTGVPFDFHDAGGAPVSMTSSQVVDTSAAPLFYVYEGVPAPLPTPPPTELARIRSMEKQRIPEMVGATQTPLTLANETATAVLPVSQPTGPAKESGAARRVYLNIENITSSGHPGSYLVYLNLPPNEKPEEHPELYVGLLPMFGVKESTKGNREHPSHGVRYRLEATNVVRTLESRNDWNPQELRISFVPQREPSARETAAVGAPVEVGRVSLYYS